MSRLSALFEKLRLAQQAGFVAFITGGDPDFKTSLEIGKALIEAGIDLLEVGMPFSDPMAEGAAIQASSQRALNAGMSIKKIFQWVQSLRKTDQQTPIILMGYYNPILSYGVSAWAQDAVSAGADGAIIVDLPPEEDEELRYAAQKYGLAVIRLIAPTSEKRLPLLVKTAQSFLYYISITGTTGGGRPNFEHVAKKINQLRQHSKLPIALGFGIKTEEDSKKAAELADLVVVGSALVEKIAAGGDIIQAVSDFAKAHKIAITSVKKG